MSKIYRKKMSRLTQKMSLLTNIIVISSLIILIFPASFAETTGATFKFKAAFAQFEIPVQTPLGVGFLEIDAYHIQESTFGNNYDVLQYIAVIGADSPNPTYAALLTLTDNKQAADLITKAVYPSPVILVKSHYLNVVIIDGIAIATIPKIAGDYGFPYGILTLKKETPLTQATLIVSQPTPAGYVINVNAKEFLSIGSLNKILPTRAGHAWISQSGTMTITSLAETPHDHDNNSGHQDSNAGHQDSNSGHQDSNYGHSAQ